MAVCLAIVSDLIFATKIRSTAEALGSTCRVAASLGALEDALGSSAVGLAIVDMQVQGISAEEAIREIKAHRPATRVIAYFSHVQAELMTTAREAGADEAWPRSKFVQELPGLFTP